MNMEMKGKVVRLLPLRTGTGKNGEWKKQDFIVETQGQYPKQVCFSLWGDKIDKHNLAEGEDVSIAFDLESKEYNDRWYTNVRAWKVSKNEGIDVAPPHTDEPPFEDKGIDNLPF